MNAGIKLLVGLYGFLSLLLVASVILVVTGVYNAFSALLNLQQGNEVFWILIGLLTFLGLMSFAFLVASFTRSSNSEKELQVRTDMGTIGISKQSIESTTLKSIRRFEGMRQIDVEARIFAKNEQVRLSITYTPFGPSPVQQTAKQMQESVKRDVESWLEVSVREVRIYVIDANAKSSKKERVV
ncbi:alkaline shock response membrane anchor protein AmaP [Shouchella shacheensis]|uniref:alkaline shock response membrane anchor protein AmaP n=1 Tax=Shouchella shacheensis TaxID=1649580 RepID=UPI00074029F8|nr:alkaline shock response membrane anchor protein AmaP [Shouchella shacheensis]